MSGRSTCDEDLVRRLPLPLAQLYRRAYNAKTPLDRHQAAFYLWEASLKLLGSVAIVAYAERPEHDPDLAERLKNLARPSLGHWWEFVRRLLPILADGGDDGFRAARDFVLGRARSDLPKVAALDTALREALGESAGSRSTVRMSELFNRLVEYRNKYLGHASLGMGPSEFYEHLGLSLRSGAAELLGKLETLAGRRMVYIDDVRRQADGRWLIERVELTGESARRIESLESTEHDAAKLPLPARIYLVTEAERDRLRPLSLHPLVIYDPDTDNALLLNARRDRQRTEYLAYVAGPGPVERTDLGCESRALLARILGTPVDDAQLEAWMARSQQEEAKTAPPEETSAIETALRRLGEFELLSELGRGNMGVVYRAWQPSLGRQVALKRTLRAGDPKSEARFQREIRALGKVDHPNLVKIFTSGFDGDQWFYAMELVEGVTLAAVCDTLHGRSPSASGVDLATWQESLSTACEEARKAEKTLSDDGHGSLRPTRAALSRSSSAATGPSPGDQGYVRHVVELLRQAALAAHALHEAGVVHRDIKPGNLMLTTDGSQAVLMDLGLAQLADDAQGKLTRTRQFVGTLRYASPEQVLSVGGVDRRSDIYSLGATLWELLTLRRLFDADEQTPTPELMRRITSTDPERVRKHHPGIARDLEAIVHKCLEKDPARRYASAGDLAADLEHWQRGELVTAQPLTAGYVLSKALRQHRRPIAAAVVLLVLGLVGLLAEVRRIDQARRDAEGAATRQAELRTEADRRKGEADLQRNEAFKQRNEAIRLGKEAQDQRTLADQRKTIIRRSLYAAQFQLAAAAWREGDTEQALSRIDSDYCRPSPSDPADFRDWEWYFLKGLCSRGMLTIPSRANTSVDLLFSPDGRRLALISGYPSLFDRRNATIRLWDILEGRELHVFSADKSRAGDPVFSRDGRLLAVSLDGEIVQIWDTATGEVIRTFADERPARIAFSPDGRTLASSSAGERVRLRDVSSGHELRGFRAPKKRVTVLLFSADGRTLAGGTDDNTIILWNVADGSPIRVITDGGFLGNNPNDCPLTFSPDGRWLAVTDAFEVKLFGLAHERETRSFSPDDLFGPKPRGNSVFSPDGLRLMYVDDKASVNCWNVPSGTRAFTIKSNFHDISTPILSPDSRLLAAIGGDGSVKLWTRSYLGQKQARQHRSLVGHSSEVKALAFSPDGRFMASGGRDRVLRLWDVALGRTVHTFEGYTGVIGFVAFSSDGRILVSDDSAKSLRVWDVASRRPLGGFATTSTVDGLTVSPDGRLLAFGGNDRIIHVRDIATGAEVRALTGHRGRLDYLAFGPGAKLLASADSERDVRIWNVAKGSEQHVLEGHASGINAIAFAPDGTYFASGDSAGTVRVWDVASGRPLRALAGDPSAVACLSFSPSSRTLAAGLMNGMVLLWDRGVGDSFRIIRGHRSSVKKIAFTASGERLASTSSDGTLKLWDVASGQEMLTLKERGIDGNALAFSSDGWVLAATGSDDAISLWDAAMLSAEGAQPTPTMLSSRGLMRAESGWWEMAVSDLTRAIEGGILDWNVFYQRGRSHAALGHTGDAIADYSKALELAPDSPAIFLSRHLLFAESGRSDDAARDYAEAAARSHAVSPRARDYSPRYFDTPPSAAPDAWSGVLEDLGRAIDEGADHWWTWRARGLAHLARAEWKEAVADLSKAAEARPDDVDTLVGRGVAYLEQEGELGKALADLSRAVKLGRDDHDVWHFLGYLHHRLRDEDEAINDYTKAIALGATEPAAWAFRGRAYFNTGHWQEADADFTKFTELLGRDSRIISLRGLARAERGDWKGARADAALLIGNDKGWFGGSAGKTTGLFLEARALLAQGNPEAEKACNKAIETDGQNGALWLLRSLAHAASGRLDHADADYEQAYAKSLQPDYTKCKSWAYRIVSAPSIDQASWNAVVSDCTKRINAGNAPWWVYRARGLALAALQKWSRAFDDFHASVASKADDGHSLKGRGRVRAELNLWMRAIADLTEAAKQRPRDWEVQYMLGAEHSWGYDYAAALAAFDRARGSGVAVPALWNDRSFANLKLSRWSDAASDTSKYLDAIPDDGKMWYRLGLAQSHLGNRWNDVVASCAKAAALMPGDKSVVFLLGRAHAAIGQHEAALLDFTEACKIAPDNGAIRLSRHLARVRLGRWESAEEDYERSLQSLRHFDMIQDVWWADRASIPGLADEEDWQAVVADLTAIVGSGKAEWRVWRARGLAHAALAQWDKAVADFSRALELESKPPDEAALRGRARCLMELQRWDKAIADWKEALDLNGNYSAARYFRGVCHARQGRDPDALKDFDAAIRGGAYGWAPYGERGRVKERRAQWQGAVADFTRVIEKSENTWLAWERRGIARANSRLWDDAKADFRAAISRGANRPDSWQVLAVVQLLQGKEDDYRETCKSLVDRFGAVSDPATVASVLYTLTAAPEAVPDFRPALRVAGDALARSPNEPLLSSMLGCALYRAGRFQDAIDRLDQTAKLDSPNGYFEAWLFEAMAHARLGHSQQAYAWLSKTVRAMPQSQTVVVQRLADEASRLILDKAFPANPFAPNP